MSRMFWQVRSTIGGCEHSVTCHMGSWLEDVDALGRSLGKVSVVVVRGNGLGGGGAHGA